MEGGRLISGMEEMWKLEHDVTFGEMIADRRRFVVESYQPISRYGPPYVLPVDNSFPRGYIIGIGHHRLSAMRSLRRMCDMTPEFP